MKKYTNLLLAILVLPLFITSCVDDDDATEVSENCYISSFYLGSLNRTIYGVTLSGQDSIYTISYSGTVYTMSINQRTLTIENLDSLPVRTQLNAVLATVEFDGELAWRKADITNLEDTTWTAYNSSDSIDFSSPLHFRVYSQTGNSSRTYTVKVNVHQQEGDSTVWNRMATDAPLMTCGTRKALIWGDKLAILAVNGGDSLTCGQHALGLAGDWTSTPAVGTLKAVPSTLQTLGAQLYLSTTDGRVITSTDAVNWTPAIFPAKAGLTLVAASAARLYALAEGKLWSSDGGAWTEENLDDEAENLPVDNLNSVFYTLKNGMPRILLVGRRNTTDTSATLWAKSWETCAEQQAQWVYYTPNGADKYRCPMLQQLCVLPYDGGLQAFGGRSRDGRYVAMDSIFHSADHGITWKVYEEDDMKVDPNLRTAAQSAQYLTAAVDDDNYLWIVVDEKVWRRRINRLGFLRR